MASAWQTLEEAALTLGISSRTLHRRLSRGEFETRLENGRREVLVVIPESVMEIPQADLADMADTSEDMSDAQDQPTEALADGGVELSEEISTTMLALHEDRIRRTDLAIMAYQQSVNVTGADARRAHRNARIAWGLVGAMAVGVFVTGMWSMHSVTRANGQVEHLTERVRQVSDTAEARQRQIEALRESVSEARVVSARMEGELSVTKGRFSDANRDATAATQPVSVIRALMDRVTMR